MILRCIKIKISISMYILILSRYRLYYILCILMLYFRSDLSTQIKKLSLDKLLTTNYFSMLFICTWQLY